MDIGSYNRFVTIVTPTDDEDAYGQPTPAWVKFADSWANIRNLSGMEAVRAAAETAITKASIRLRTYRSDITSSMRVVYGATVYEIKAVLPDEERRQHTDLVCELVR